MTARTAPMTTSTVLELVVRPGPATLHRVSSVLAHQRVHVRALSLSPSSSPEHALLTLELGTSSSADVEQLAKRLRRQLAVLAVSVATRDRGDWHAQTVKVFCDAGARAAAIAAGTTFGARVLDVEDDGITFAAVGSLDELDMLDATLEAHGSVAVRHALRLPAAPERAVAGRAFP